MKVRIAIVLIITVPVIYLAIWYQGVKASLSAHYVELAATEAELKLQAIQTEMFLREARLILGGTNLTFNGSEK